MHPRHLWLFIRHLSRRINTRQRKALLRLNLGLHDLKSPENILSPEILLLLPRQLAVPQGIGDAHSSQHSCCANPSSNGGDSGDLNHRNGGPLDGACNRCTAASA